MSDLRLIDLHNDFLPRFVLGHNDTDKSEVFHGKSESRQIKAVSTYLKKAGKSGVRGTFVSIWTTEMQNPTQQIRYFRRIIDNINTKVRLFLHIEDAWFLNEKNIDEIIGLRPFSVGLTWNAKNNLTGGAASKGSLTKLGEKIIKKLVAHGIVVDLAHLNKPSFYQVAKILKMQKQRLFCSHTCFAELNPHFRNLDRRQVQTIVDSGGIVGLTLVGDFLSSKKQVQMQDVYRHIEYFVKNFGEDNLAIGTDFHGTDNLPKGLCNYKGFSRLGKFLISKGLNQDTIDKIFYSNAKDFFK